MLKKIDLTDGLIPSIPVVLEITLMAVLGIVILKWATSKIYVAGLTEIMGFV